MTPASPPLVVPVARLPRWLWWLAVPALFVLSLLVAFVGFRLVHGRAVTRLLAEIRARGEPVTLAELAASYSPVDPASNAAMALIDIWAAADPGFWEAFRAGRRPGSEPTRAPRHPGVPVLGAAAGRLDHTNAIDPESLRLGQEHLAASAGLLRDLRAALARPAFRVPVRFSDGFQLQLPHLAEMKEIAGLFRLEALVTTETGDIDRAVDAIGQIGRVADCLSEEPFLISQLVRISCGAIAFSATERLLSRQVLSEVQFVALGTALAGLHSRDGLKRSLLAERANVLPIFSGESDGLMPDETGGIQHRAHMKMLGLIGLRDFDQRFLLETYAEAIRLAEQGGPDSVRRTVELFAAVPERTRGFPPRIFSRLMLPALDKAAAKFARLDAAHAALRVALAVERHRVTGAKSPPAALAELPSDLLPSVPLDPFDGQPLRYRRLPRGYVVYSVGADRVDQQARGTAGAGATGAPAELDVPFRVER